MKPLLPLCTASFAALFIAQACVTDLGSWSAADINDAGVIVGKRGGSTQQSRAVVRLADGTLKELPNYPGDARSEAIAVANTGVVIGNGMAADGGWHPVIWGTDGSVRSLGQLDGRNTRATAANDSGVVVGNTHSTFRAWVYDPSVGHIRELPVPSGTSASSAAAINDRGEIVGLIGFLTGPSRPIQWEPKTYAFAYLPRPEPVETWVGAINDSGVVVGSYDGKPAVWQSSTAEPSLLSSGTWTYGRAIAINDAGDIVGKVQLEPTIPGLFPDDIFGKAAMWTARGEFVDLEPVGEVGEPIVSEAVAINASGAVIGNTKRSVDNPGGRATRFR